MARQSASELFEYYEGTVLSILGFVHLAAGDASAAREAWEAARQRTGMDPTFASTYNWAAGSGVGVWRSRSGPSLGRRRRSGDEGLLSYPISLASRARVEIAQGELDAADAMPTTRSIWRPDLRAISSFRLRSTAWPLRRATQATTCQRRDCSAPPTQPASTWA